MRNIQTAVSPHALIIGHMFIWTYLLGTVRTSGRQPVVRQKILVVRGEIWTLFAIFMFIILISNKQQQISH